jgi:hypothetical protein
MHERGLCETRVLDQLAIFCACLLAPIVEVMS